MTYQEIQNKIVDTFWSEGLKNYIRSVQLFSQLCTMLSCSTLHDLAAACKKLADS